MGQRTTSQGAPPRVPSPGLCSPRQTPGTTWPHGLQAARCPERQRKRSLAPTTPLLGPQKRSGGVKHLPHDGGGVPAQAGSHQKNRREQKFASCSGLGFPILPAGAAAGRGRAALVMQLLLEAPAGRLEAQTQRGPLSGRQNHLLQGVEPRGAARSAPLPLGPGVGSGGGSRTKGRPGGLCRGPRRCEARLQARLMEPLRETAAPKAPDRGAYVWVQILPKGAL